MSSYRYLSLCLMALGLLQCKAHGSPTASEQVGPEYDPPPLAAPRVVQNDQDEKQRLACEARMREVLSQPAVPGAAAFNERRLAILTKAKAEPLWLTQTPQFEDDDDNPPGPLVLGYRKLLAETDHPWDALKALLPKFKKRPFIGRAVLLRDGYLYTDSPKMAYAIVAQLGAEHLFGHDRIWIQRGSATYHAERKSKGLYYFVDGPNEGDEVRLLLYDRIGHGKAPDPDDTIVRDFRELRYRLHFNQAKVRHVTRDALVVNLRYSNVWVPSVLSSQGARLELECEIIGDALAPQVNDAKAEADRRAKVVQALRGSMMAQIEDQLPFDEPRHEYGFQLDGKLRRNWLHAYLEGRPTYNFNGDRYFVYNRRGKPLIPQVCVDFLTDTFERASGTWWAEKGTAPARIVGKLDYEPMNLLERAKLRRVPGFLAHARQNPDKFEVLDVAERERVPLGERSRFLGFLQERSDDFQPGDIVMIRGKTPWDPVELHYHSFFVYESDPLSGIPLAVVGNAGRPTVRYWEVEAKRTPEREIWHRIRPTTSWLESIIAHPDSANDTPAPISPPGNAG